MRRKPDDTEPGPMPSTEPGPPPEMHDETHLIPPPIPYEVETRNEDVNQLLRSLQQPSRAPRPVDVPTTDGELAAQYHAPAHPLPAGNETPEPTNVRIRGKCNIASSSARGGASRANRRPN